MHDQRTCPECDLALKNGLIGDVELDTCSQCMGIWFDYNELKTVSQGSGDQPKIENLLSATQRNLEKRKRKCPCCETFMSLKQRSGVELDLCQRCGGIWLDGGELTQVLEPYQKEQGRLDRGEKAGKKVLERNLGIQPGSQRPTLAHDPKLELNHRWGRPRPSLQDGAGAFLTELGVEALGAFLFGILDP